MMTITSLYCAVLSETSKNRASYAKIALLPFIITSLCQFLGDILARTGELTWLGPLGFVKFLCFMVVLCASANIALRNDYGRWLVRPQNFVKSLIIFIPVMIVAGSVSVGVSTSLVLIHDAMGDMIAGFDMYALYFSILVGFAWAWALFAPAFALLQGETALTMRAALGQSLRLCKGQSGRLFVVMVFILIPTIVTFQVVEAIDYRALSGNAGLSAQVINQLVSIGVTAMIGIAAALIVKDRQEVAVAN